MAPSPSSLAALRATCAAWRSRLDDAPVNLKDSEKNRVSIAATSSPVSSRSMASATSATLKFIFLNCAVSSPSPKIFHPVIVPVNESSALREMPRPLSTFSKSSKGMTISVAEKRVGVVNSASPIYSMTS